MKYFLICVTQCVTYSGFVKFSNIIEENAFPLGEIKANDPPLKGRSVHRHNQLATCGRHTSKQQKEKT